MHILNTYFFVSLCFSQNIYHFLIVYVIDQIHKHLSRLKKYIFCSSYHPMECKVLSNESSQTFALSAPLMEMQKAVSDSIIFLKVLHNTQVQIFQVLVTLIYYTVFIFVILPCLPPLQQTLEMKLKPLHEKLQIYEHFKQSCVKAEEHIKVRTKGTSDRCTQSLPFQKIFTYSWYTVHLSLDAERSH